MDGVDAYIWRKSVRHQLEVGGSEAYFEADIRFFLEGLGVDLDSIPSRRSLANVLYKNNRLTGDFGKYMDSFINVPDKVGKPIERRTAQVISFADFKNGRDGR